MKQTGKRLLGIILSILLVMFFALPISVEAVSESNVLKWMNDNMGKALDYDGAYGTQCVDLANYYLRDVFGISPIAAFPVSYAYQMFDYNAPAGFTKISGNSSFKVGDMVIWNKNRFSGDNTGHVGLVYSVNGSAVVIFDQSPGGKAVTHNINYTGYIRGVFRPTLTTPIPLPSTSADIPNGVYAIQHKGSGKYISACNSTANGIGSQLYGPGMPDGITIAADQKFAIERLSDNTYKLTSQHSKKVLDISGGSTAIGAQVVQYDWQNSNNQHWFIVDCNDGYYKFIVKHSGQALDVNGGQTANGTRIQQYTDNGTSSQRFKLLPQFLPTTSANIPNGVYSLQHQGSGKYVSTGNNTANSAEAFLYEPGRGNGVLGEDQKFSMERLSDNTYKITSQHSKRVLAIVASKMHQGAAVIQYDWLNIDDQHWYIIDCGNGYYKLIIKHSGQAMDVQGSKTANGTRIQQYYDNGTSAQRFRLICQGPHAWGAWKTIKAATKTETGTKEHTCSVCKKIESATIPKLTAPANQTYVSMRIGKTAAIQNGKKTTIDNQGTKPFKSGSRTMLPIRFIGEKMGGKVTYTNAKAPIYIKYGDITVELKINGKSMTVTQGKAKKTVTLDVPATLSGGRVFLPLRAVSEALGFDVYYEKVGSAEYVIVNNPKMTATIKKERIAEAKKIIG